MVLERKCYCLFEVLRPFALKMKAAFSFQNLVSLYQTPWAHIRQDILYSHCYQSLNTTVLHLIKKELRHRTGLPNWRLAGRT
jgi:hypothetical protein